MGGSRLREASPIAIDWPKNQSEFWLGGRLRVVVAHGGSTIFSYFPPAVLLHVMP